LQYERVGTGQHPKSLGQQLRDKNKNNNTSNKKTLKQEKKKGEKQVKAFVDKQYI